MSLINWSPINSFSQYYNDDSSYFEMNHLINNIFNNIDSTSKWDPKIGIYENEKEYEINIESPGINKKDFNIKLNNGILKVSGKKKSSNNYVESEYRIFSKTFKLSKDIIAKNLNADYSQGILKICIKKSEANLSKDINIPIK